MHSSRMRTARSSSRRGEGSPLGTPREQALPGRDHPPNQTHPPVNRITDACENITLSQLRCWRKLRHCITSLHKYYLKMIWIDSKDLA